MRWKRSWTGLVTCALALLVCQVCAAPVDSEKSGEDQVKDAVHKAEEAAKQAAEESITHGHKAESKVSAAKINRLAAEIEDNASMKDGRAVKKVNMLIKHFRKHPREEEAEDYDNIKRIKEHRVHGKPSLSHLMGLSDLGDLATGTNSYKEDTKLEDRLAMEAEEEKKYEEGYGGGQGWEGEGSESKGASWSSNIQRQDAAEKQNIQAQVASESAHELNEIQQAIASESQASRGTASIGEQGASVIQVGGTGMENGNRQWPQSRQEESQRGMEATATFEAPRAKSFESSNRQPSAFEGLQNSQLPFHQSDLEGIINQAGKLSSNEMRGPPKQFSSEEGMNSLSSLGGLGSLGRQSSEGYASIGQQNSLGGVSLSREGGGPTMESSLGGGERTSLSQSAFTGGLGGGAMEGGSIMGGALAGLGGRGGMIDHIGENSIQGMNTLGASFAGSQQPMMTGGGGASMMVGGGANLQSFAGLQSLGAAGGGVGGLQSLGAADGMGGLQSFGAGGGMMANQMGFKKRSKTAKVDKDQTKLARGSREEKSSTSKKSKLNRLRHHRHHHHHKRHY